MKKVVLHPRSRRTHCQRGHEFTPENTYVEADGDRHCRTCVRLRRERSAAASARAVCCPDCGVERMVLRPVRPDKRHPDGVCRACANRRRAEFARAVPIVASSEYEEFWLSRFSLAEIRELWSSVSLYLDSPLEEAA